MKMNERMDYLFRVCSSECFLKNQGVGREISYYICPFAQKEAHQFEKEIQQLEERLRTSGGINVLEINLYDLVEEILNGQGVWQDILDQEQNMSKDELNELMQSLLEPSRVLVPAIAKKVRGTELQLLFISGCGEVFPYIRTHSLIENMQNVITEIPVVFLFPGDYTQTRENGSSLDLFDRFHSQRYYRAHNIYLVDR